MARTRVHRVHTCVPYRGGGVRAVATASAAEGRSERAHRDGHILRDAMRCGDVGVN